MKLDCEEFTRVWNEALDPERVANFYDLAVSTVTGYASLCRARGWPCINLKRSVFPEEMFITYWQEANTIRELQLNLARDGWFDEAKNLVARAYRLRLKGLELKKMGRENERPKEREDNVTT
jgi:hypothetical protein